MIECKISLLNILRDVYEKPKDDTEGICNNVHLGIYDLDEDGTYRACVDDCFDNLKDKVVEKWVHFSGYYSYPVPHTEEGYCCETMYHCTNNMWIGKYGELRKDLLRCMIEQLEEDIANDLERIKDKVKEVLKG